ncbi:MAG: hypothetical protein WAM85_15795 [Terracidiphilus sp.]
MTRDEDIDIETFRRTRTGGFREWRLDLGHKFRNWRADLLGRFMQKGWLETEAEAICSRPIGHKYKYISRNAQPTLSGWAVNFTYDVDGKSFDGIAISRAKMNIHNKFIIRYNPAHPEENNTLATKLDWIDGFVTGAYDLFLVVLLGTLIVAGLLLRR